MLSGLHPMHGNQMPGRWAGTVTFLAAGSIVLSRPADEGLAGRESSSSSCIKDLIVSPQKPGYRAGAVVPQAVSLCAPYKYQFEFLLHIYSSSLVTSWEDCGGWSVALGLEAMCETLRKRLDPGF